MLYAVMQRLLSHARGRVLLSCDTLVTGHQQLGWISLSLLVLNMDVKS